MDIVTKNAEPKPGLMKLIIPTSDPAAVQSLIVKGKLKNNGRSIGFTVDTGASPIKINAYKGSFTLRQFHFHFGCEDEMGSEHSLDGQRFPGEVIYFLSLYLYCYKALFSSYIGSDSTTQQCLKF